MRKIILGALATLFLVGSAFGASAAKPQEGDEPRNTHGLCTAYFNGQKKGHDKNGQPGPFEGLEAAAEAWNDTDENEDNDDLEGPSAVFDYCNSVTNIGGNPEENGRYTECFDGDSADDEDSDPCND